MSSSTIGAGDTLDVPAGTPHAMWNPGPGRARAVWQTRPALKTEAFFEMVWGLAQAARSGEEMPDPDGPPRCSASMRTSSASGGPTRNELAATAARRGASERVTGQGELHVGDPRFDDWEVMGDFDSVDAARAWRQHLEEAGLEAVITSDHPLDRFGRGTSRCACSWDAGARRRSS